MWIRANFIMLIPKEQISVFDLFAENLNVTSRPDVTITETNTDNKPERPKPPTSLLTDTLQAIPPTQIPIVSPDRSLHSFFNKNMLKAYFTPTHKHLQTYLYLHMHTFKAQASGISIWLCSLSVVHRRTERRTQTMILCPHRPLSQRAPCCRSSADQRLPTKKRPTPSTLYTVSKFCAEESACAGMVSL